MRSSRGTAYAVAACATAVAFALRALVEPWLHGQLPFVTMFGAVAVAVWFGGAGPAIFVAVIGFAASGMWMLDARSPFDLFSAAYLIAAIGYGVSCALIIGFGEMLRRTRSRLEREVEQRRQAEAIARDTAEQYRYTVELHPQVTWSADADGGIDRIAERWRDWTGSPALDDGWITAFHPDDREASIAAWRRSTESGDAYDVEHRIRMRSGAYRWARSRAFAHMDPHGRVVRWYGSTEDIHERKGVEGELEAINTRLGAEVAMRTAALKDSEARMRAVFSTSLQYQGLLGVDGKLVDANPTSLRGIEARLEEVVGIPYWDTPWFTATPGLPELVREGVLAAAHGESLRREFTLQLPGGARVFDFAMRPVVATDGSVVAIVPEAVDVTDRRQAEEKLRQAQKMEAVGQLTGGVAHDFNNMLQIISSNLHLVARYVPEHEKVQSRLAIAQGAVARGAKLANQLLAFGRRQALEPKVVHVGRLIAAMDDMLRRTIGEAVEVRLDVADRLWNSFVDPAQIENAVLNLAINGRDAMAGSGRLTIAVANATLDGGASSPADLPAGQYVVVAVSDSGAGMTEDVVSQAFEPFFSTKPVGAGSGLGLSMVYGFVKQSGGQVRIHSEVGRGTTVRLYLPRVREGEDSQGPTPPAETTGGSETILVVEDDDAVRAATVEMLGQLGYRVLEASDANAARSLVESGAPVDVLFTDVVMPGTLQSTELARLARGRLPEMAVLFTSGYTRDAIVHGGRLDDGVELLAKPYTLDALARRLRTVLCEPGRRGRVPAPGQDAGQVPVLDA